MSIRDKFTGEDLKWLRRELFIMLITATSAYTTDDYLEQQREQLEATADGEWAKANCPDRHLYAIQRPTRAENMRRIVNLLRVYSDEKLDAAFDQAFEILVTDPAVVGL
jgi:hypothetical protein